MERKRGSLYPKPHAAGGGQGTDGLDPGSWLGTEENGITRPL